MDSTEWNFFCALYGGRSSSYISYNTLENEGLDEMILVSNNMTPEQIVIQKSEINALSPRAKQVLQIVVTDWKKLATPATGKITMASISRYLSRELKWNPNTIKKVIRELEAFMEGK